MGWNSIAGSEGGSLYEQDMRVQKERERRERPLIDSLNRRSGSVKSSSRLGSPPPGSGVSSRYSSSTVKDRRRAPSLSTTSRTPYDDRSRHDQPSSVSMLSERTANLQLVGSSREIEEQKAQRRKDKDIIKWDKQQRLDRLGIHTPASSEYSGPGGKHSIVGMGESLDEPPLVVPRSSTGSSSYHSKSRREVDPSVYSNRTGTTIAPRSRRLSVAPHPESQYTSYRRVILPSDHGSSQHTSTSSRPSRRMSVAPSRPPSEYRSVASSHRSERDSYHDDQVYDQVYDGYVQDYDEGYAPPAPAPGVNVNIINNVVTNHSSRRSGSRR
ncbi:hypothetical protein SBOR_10038 [Sclerotinia borealis F-4128]|uniref:Uncharacterized protein n=1 Tax=Sclerotinia borealis (strain F-4128) TaxID=1432307 RepID=W9C3R9_SCLBF|nr:hypothetical protein SBOR_10038 [Sclerotinia borealis F-4128]